MPAIPPATPVTQKCRRCPNRRWARSLVVGFLSVSGLMGATHGGAQTKDDRANSGPTSLREVYTDWTVSCHNHPPQSRSRLSNCQMSQELRDKKSGQLVLAFALPSKPGKDGANAIVVAPFGLNLSKGIGLSVADTGAATAQTKAQLDTAKANAPFHTCLPAGCLARFTLNDTMINALRRGVEARVKMTSADEDKTVEMKISLKGFTAAERRLKSLAAQFD